MSYSFYFEVNSTNLKSICNFIKYNTSWEGFSIGNTKVTDFPNYLDSNLTLHNNNIQLYDLNVPENSFLVDWNDVTGYSQISIDKWRGYTTCKGNACKTWYPPNVFLKNKSLDANTFYYPQEVRNMPYVQGKSNVFHNRGVDWNTYKQSVEYLRNPRYKYEGSHSTKKLVNTQSTGFKYGDYVYNTTIPWNYPYSIEFGNVSGGDINTPGYSITPTARQTGKFPKVADGKVTYNYKVFKPTSYTQSPVVKKNLYFPPKSFQGGFYNYGSFIGNLELVYNSINENNLPCSGSKINNKNKNSNKKVYAIYEVRYNIPFSSFSKPEFFNELQDFLYFQINLYNKSSSTFKYSDEWKTTKSNIEQLISDYCNYSGNMSSSLCSGTKNNFPFTTILPGGSPCMNSQECFKGWNKHCFKNEKNISSSLCNNYYSSQYIGDPNDNSNRLLNDSIVYNLEKKCQKDFLSTESPEKNLSQDWWNTCACFLPNEYYNDILEKNNMKGKSIGDQSCWYLPCQVNGLKRQTNATCPNNEVMTCIQNAYITYSSTNPKATANDNIVHMNQTIKTCGKPVKEAEPIVSGTSSGMGSLFPSSQKITPTQNISTPLDNIQTMGPTLDDPEMTPLESTTTGEPTTKKNLPAIIGGSTGGLTLIIILAIIFSKR